MADDQQPASDTTQSEGPGRAFAGLMSAAHAAATPEAPYGWTTDRVTGEQRPKKTAGRPRLSPSLDELKAAALATAEADQTAGSAAGREPDREPRAGRRRGRHAKDEPGQDGQPETTPYTPGVIARGMNRLYRRAGKIVRAMDRDIGVAIIEATRNTAADGEPDDSIGAAWEEVARTNPRIRATLMKMIAGGAWGQLLMAHAPIFLAIVMKDGVRKHLPFIALLESVAEPDDDASEQEKADAPTPGDIREMLSFAQHLMANIGRTVPQQEAA